MRQAVDIVEGLSHVRAVSLLGHLHRNVFGAIAYDTIREHLIAAEESQTLTGLRPEQKKMKLDSQTSIETTHSILMHFARHPDLAPVLMQAWDEIREDDTLMIDALVTLGLVANLTLFMATTEFEFTIGKLKVRKKTADPALIKELARPITEWLKRPGKSS